jgi:uncharacterized protein YjbI with pentapeptide repeats
MLPEKPVKPAKSSFTDEQIRVKAYQLWEKNKEQSPEENWNSAVKALERERFWRPLISVWRWTGIGEKKGWDIFTGLSLPLIVFGGGILFNYLNGQQQQKIAEEKQKDELLKTYINDIKALLLDKDYPLKDLEKNSESSSIARTITLTTLTQLNSEQDQQKAKERKYNQRKGLIMQFLYESDLIKIDPKVNSKFDSIIFLDKADFTFANLERAHLYGVHLYGVHLYGANLKSAHLYGANLKSANLESANLKSAILKSANLYNANLERANLSRANLSRAQLNNANLNNANLENAYLSRANLNNADLENANLENAVLYKYNAKNLTNEQIKSACFWEKAIYTELDLTNGWPTNGWIAKDPKANQRKIDEIKQDKASDPLERPDCSKWK